MCGGPVGLGRKLQMRTGREKLELGKMSVGPRFSQLDYDRLGWSGLGSGEGPFRTQSDGCCAMLK